MILHFLEIYLAPPVGHWVVDTSCVVFIVNDLFLEMLV